MIPTPMSTIPPWKDRGQWAELQWSLEYLTRRHRARLAKAYSIADSIEAALLDISPDISELCIISCVPCRDICCKRATVWYDLRDSLFIHLRSHGFLQSQLFKKPGESCSCLTPSGCRIPRLRRPFVCTWYFCPAQTAILQGKEAAALKKKLDDSLEKIKRERRHLEEEFIRLTG